MLAAEEYVLTGAQQVLEGDPAGAFLRSDYPTRLSYLHEVHTLARWAGKDDDYVAEVACQLAAQAVGDLRRSHVGYYLIAEGRLELEPMLGCRVPVEVGVARALRRRRVALYLALLWSVSLLWIVGVLSLVRHLDPGCTALQLALPAILLVPVSIRVTNLLIDSLVSILLYPPRPLPKLDFSRGIPEDCQTVIIYPILIASLSDARDVQMIMDSNYRSNPDPGFVHALLTDFADAPSQHMPGDAALMREIDQLVSALNAKHGSPGRVPFCHLHRERQRNLRVGAWMGRERKRGKLMDFLGFLQAPDDRSFNWQVGDPSVLRDIRFVITLDADTLMAHGTAVRLVGTIAHPLNRAVWNETSQRLEAGYSIVQPRIEVHPSVPCTVFSAYVNGYPSPLPGNPEVRGNLFHDLFEKGYFWGKAIIDPLPFERSLTDRIADNSVLSHDKLEGWLARAGFASDIVVFDEVPTSLVSDCRRHHRWVRGDFQLLPWLLPWVRGQHRWSRNPLGALERWALVDDQVYASRPPAIFILLVLVGLGIVPGPSWAWMGILLGTTALPIFVGPVAILLRGPIDRVVLPQSSEPTPPSILGTRRQCFWGVLQWELYHWLIEVASTAHVALVAIDAVGRTLWRLVSRQRLLEWTPSAQVRRAGETRSIWRELWKTPCVVACIGGSIGWLNPAALPWMIPLLTAWFFTPWLARVTNVPLVATSDPTP